MRLGRAAVNGYNWGILTRREGSGTKHLRTRLLGLTALAVVVGVVAFAIMRLAGVHLGLADVGAPVSASPRQARVSEVPLDMAGLVRQVAAQTGSYVDDEILVRFLPATRAEVIQEAHRQADGRVIDEIRALRVQVVRVRPGEAVSRLAAYQGNPNVEYAELNGIAHALDDPLFPTQWGLNNTGQLGGTPDADIDAPEAWAVTTGSGIKIAVLDTGIRKSHEDITAARVVAEANFSTSATADDIYGHGTHVAGIAAAAANGVGVHGVASGALLMNGKVLGDSGSGSYSGIANGMTWAADNGAQVINLSLGGTIPSQTLKNAVDYAWGQGVVLACAAGNNGNTQNHYPSAYTNCIAVAATDNLDQKASFSSYGSWVDVAAPGVGIASTVPPGAEAGPDSMGLLFITSASNLERDANPLQYSETTATAGLEAAAVNAGLGTTSDFASIDCTGKIAVIQRGDFTFALKVTNAKDDGCVGAVIYNNESGNFNGTLGAPGDWLPALSISQADGEDLVNKISAGPTTLKMAVVSGYAEWSGTSMATPFVAGEAALVWATCHGTDASSVRNRIEATADNIPGTGSFWAHGRIDAGSAVSGCSPAPTDSDGDSLGLGDPFGLFFRDSVEVFLGTLPLLACPVTSTTGDEDPDATGPDFDDSQDVDGSDVFLFAQRFGTELGVPTPLGKLPYIPRFDIYPTDVSLNKIDGSDVFVLATYFGKSCV